MIVKFPTLSKDYAKMTAFNINDLAHSNSGMNAAYILVWLDVSINWENAMKFHGKGFTRKEANSIRYVLNQHAWFRLFVGRYQTEMHFQHIDAYFW